MYKCSLKLHHNELLNEMEMSLLLLSMVEENDINDSKETYQFPMKLSQQDKNSIKTFIKQEINALSTINHISNNFPF